MLAETQKTVLRLGLRSGTCREDFSATSANTLPHLPSHAMWTFSLSNSSKAYTGCTMCCRIAALLWCTQLDVPHPFYSYMCVISGVWSVWFHLIYVGRDWHHIQRISLLYVLSQLKDKQPSKKVVFTEFKSANYFSPLFISSQLRSLFLHLLGFCRLHTSLISPSAVIYLQWCLCRSEELLHNVIKY